MKNSIAILLLLFTPAFALADLRVHGIFASNMVLQRDKPIRVWGTAIAGDDITVSFGETSKSGTSNREGNWSIILDPMPVNSAPQAMEIKSGSQSIKLKNILVGDVWLCGGQSNMEFELHKIYQGDVEIASARHNEIRLLTIPKQATPDRQSNFSALNEFNSWNGQYEQKGNWQVCSPKNVRKFAGIGYLFARRLHLATGIPIGIIDNSVGGTTVEGWTSRESLETIPQAKGLIDDWDERIQNWDAEKELAERILRWEKDSQRRKERGEKPRPKPDDLKPGPAVDRNNPGASFNGMLACFAGFQMKGIIFHQGYNNALGDSRPKLYAKTLQAMIGDWRSAFDDKSLPFGIIELCAGADPQTTENFELRMVDAGPFIREAQFKAYRDLENMGWASAYDQQINWYHPQMKLLLAERMARWALATQYGLKIGHEPAKLIEHSIDGNRIILTFDSEVTVRDGRPIAGMAIAGEDGRFYPAQANFFIKGKDNRGRDQFDFCKIEVHSSLLENPTAVRYAWARCPLGNLTNRSHMERIIPLPSFRTDDWDWPEAPFGKEAGSTRKIINQQRRTAQENIQDRLRREAELLLQK